MKTYTVYTRYGKYDDITMRVEHYADGGSIAILMDSQKEGPFATLTVHLDYKLTNERCQFIDTNNCPWARDFLQAHPEIGKFTGYYGPSGFCIYPEFEFSKEFPKEHE